MQHLAVEVVDHIERSESFATGQRVTHEVHGPDGIWMPGNIQRHPLVLWQTALGRSSQVELHRLVYPIDPLRIPVRSLLA